MSIFQTIILAVALLTTTCNTLLERTNFSDNIIPVYEENFDGVDLDPQRWILCPEENRHGHLCTWKDECSYLDGEGHLILKAQWSEEEGKIHSGAIYNKGLFFEDLGYYEASIRFPSAEGIWCAFWIMAGHVTTGNGTPEYGTEIDIIETAGAPVGDCNFALHWGGYGENHQKMSHIINKPSLYDGEFHTIGLWRREDAYIFYIDGEEMWRVTEDDIGICKEPGYIYLSIEGDDWAGAGTESSISDLPAEMVVDYVRYYKLIE